MNTRLFRKAAIDHLTSPEELDQIIRVSSTGAWAALTAILLLCSAAVTWAVTGSVPTTASGEGMIVRTGGVLNVVARASGGVRTINVAVGQHVDANQAVATIAQPLLAERLRGMQDSLGELMRKRERDLKLKSEEVEVRRAALARQRANTTRLVEEAEARATLAAAEVPVMEELFKRGLVTNQQVIAARQKLIQFQGEAEQHRAEEKQLDAQEFDLSSQTAALDSDMAFQIASQQREIASVGNELALAETVAAPTAGRVVEIKVSAGGTVTADMPVISIQPDSDTLEALVYVSALQAKDIVVGMEAQVSPSTVKPEEYGFMRGRVVFVADYPATAAALMRNFQNEQLVSAIGARGPVTEVRVTLDSDPGTVSGFRWSSPAGPPLRISSGTLSTVHIVTQRRAPISLVIPRLRQAVAR
jgi:HlyD family secretion protein